MVPIPSLSPPGCLVGTRQEAPGLVTGRALALQK